LVSAWALAAPRQKQASKIIIAIFLVIGRSP
jgi:hypothetical protein